MEPCENPHISARKRRTHYHRVVADLVLKYTPRGGRVLDVGCGLGHVLALVHAGDPSAELTGADPFEMCRRLTNERVPAVRTVQIAEDTLDTESLGKNYDTCVMSHSLEHTRNPLDMVRTVLSLTKPGGHLVIAVPNPVRPSVFFGNLRKKHYVNPGHVYAWDMSHWINFLERIARLEVVEYAHDEVRFIPPRLAARLPALTRLEIAASRLAPWWSFSNIAVVRNRA